MERMRCLFLDIHISLYRWESGIFLKRMLMHPKCIEVINYTLNEINTREGFCRKRVEKM